MNKPAPPALVYALLVASVAVAVVCGFVADLNLRGWSTLLGAVSFGGIVCCTIGTIHLMDRLAIGLAAVLAGVLGTSAVAQYLLIDYTPTPETRAGLSLLIVARVLCLCLVLAWPHLVRPGGALRR